MPGESPGPAVGQPAPDLQVPTPLHGTVTLSQYRGVRHVALVFFRTFLFGGHLKFIGGGIICPTCGLMMKDLVSHYDQIRSLGAELVAISAVEPEHLRRIVAEGGSRFPLGADADGSAARAFAVYDTLWKHPRPSAFLVDREGVLRYRHVAQHQTDLPRAADLVAQLRAL